MKTPVAKNLAKPGMIPFQIITTKGRTDAPKTIAGAIQAAKASTPAGMSGGVSNTPGMTADGHAVEPDYYGQLNELNDPPSAKRIARDIESMQRQGVPTREQILANGGGILGVIRATRLIKIADQRGTG